MAKRYEISAVIGEYTNDNGETKNRYVNMGSVVDTKNGGLMLIIDSIPTNWDGKAFLNEPRERDGNHTPKGINTTPKGINTVSNDMGDGDISLDSIPF